MRSWSPIGPLGVCRLADTSWRRAPRPRRGRVFLLEEGVVRLYRLSADGREVLHEVTKRLGDRRLHCQSRLEDLVFRDARARLAALLRRSLEHEPDAPGLAFTQEERARLIGATRQTVSTALREPIDAGLVKRLRGRLHVADTGGLRAVAGLDA